jgi:hypothetical protein
VVTANRQKENAVVATLVVQMTDAKNTTTAKEHLVKLFGFTYARVGDMRQLTFLGWLLFSAMGDTWVITFQRVKNDAQF